MPLFDRGASLPDTGHHSEDQSGEGNRFVLRENPLSHLYPVPDLGTCSPTNIVRFMVALQKRTYGATILDQFPRKVLIRHCKLLLEKYDGRYENLPELIVRTIVYCGTLAEHPYSFKFVESQLRKVAWRVKGVR